MITTLVRKYMGLLVVCVTIVAFFVDGCFTSWVQNPEVLDGAISINHLLMVVMFGMGLTMKQEDFMEVLHQPKAIGVGCAAQFVVMPLLAFMLTKLFTLPEELAVGVMLVGTCPGGTASNVMTYMAKGDIALSVGMTAVSTLLAPVLTPLLTWLYLRTNVQVDAISMFLSIIQVVILPIALGFVINHSFGKYTQRVESILPLISVIAICIIIGYVIDANNEKLMTCGLLIIVVVMLHNLLGYTLGFLIAHIIKLPDRKRNSIAIEVGMQNSGLATSLATTAFPTLAIATLPGVVFSVWHNLSGAIVANIMARTTKEEES